MEGAEVEHVDNTMVVEVEEDFLPLTFEEALREVLMKSLVHDGLARGLKESVKALDRKEAHLCVLSEACDEPAYVKLITALCQENNTPLLNLADSKTIGEWAGMCKIDSEGTPIKIVGCSCVVVKSWGEESPARTRVLEEIKK